jgi:hypothetical protein
MTALTAYQSPTRCAVCIAPTSLPSSSHVSWRRPRKLLSHIISQIRETVDFAEDNPYLCLEAFIPYFYETHFTTCIPNADGDNGIGQDFAQQNCNV